jgi:peptidyl-dipeptidase Dcp
VTKNLSKKSLASAAVLFALSTDGFAQQVDQSDRSHAFSVSSSAEFFVSMNADNPFYNKSTLPFQTPDFSKIRHEHYLPAFEAGMKQQLEQIQAIADQTTEPTFENTLVAMEKSGEILERVSTVFFNLTGSLSDESLQKLEEEIAPKLAAHSDNVLLNAKLFARVDKLWKNRDKLKLSEEQSRLLKEQYESFIRAGARLTEEQKTRIRAINEELSTLTTQFQNNLLAITKERSVIVDDVKQLDGMSPGDIAAAAEAAKERGLKDKYLLTITNTTRQPVLTSLNNRALRQRVWEASAYRGLGRDGGIDNRPLVLQLAKLRAERAAILGYANHGAYTLENQMAEKPEAAFAMLRDLVPQVRKRAEEEAANIRDVMKSENVTGDVQPWDWEYYSEKVRKQKYQLDENQLKPYFELDNVLRNGVFYTLGELYGVHFRQRKDLPVYEPTVRVFDVFDENEKQIGLFYADYFQRDSKRGGAWMDNLVNQSRLLGQFPVVVNVMNIPRPAEGEPALISFDNVTTMFHELGHGVHGLFSNVEYPTLSGTSVPRDFVEFPSTFHEDWAIEPAILKNYAPHYKTGEQIPQDLLDKAIAANKFNKGFDTLEYLSAALLDLAWHSLTTDQIPTDVEAFEAKTLADFGVDFSPVPPRYRSAYFAHVWSGGYSAGYYAYLWSEVLAADAFAHMKALGGLSRENGFAYKSKVLSRGGTREVMDQYMDFRGQKPTVDALLIRRGLKVQ